MEKPVLIIMAAGLGSRYGGLKQMDPVGPHGQTLMDYSLYDAKRAGFRRAVFVISPAMAADFPADIAERVGHALDVECAIQRLDDMPDGFSLPDGRTKPWGTGHAVRAARGIVKAPFAAINADDYYGPSAYTEIYRFLSDEASGGQAKYAMVGYDLTKTLSKQGSVARGICKVDENHMLVEIHEHTHIVWSSDGPLTMDSAECYRRLPDDAIASMNMWGFSADFMQALDTRFAAFLTRALSENPLKAEYFLPEVVGEMLREKSATSRVLPCEERWFGMTYKADRPVVAEAIARMTEDGLYPKQLWK